MRKLTDFIELNVNNPATGSTELNDESSSSEMENKLKDLLVEVKKPSQAGDSLDNLNTVVGEPKEMQVSLKSLVLPPEDWTTIFSQASSSDIQKMAASIYQYGLLHRITVWQQSDDSFMILGGITRTAAFKYLYEITNDEKWLSIPAKVYATDQIDKIDANRIFIVSNTDARNMTVKNVAFAYYNLIKLEKQRTFYGSKIYSLNAAAKQVNVAPSTFNNYLKLIELYPPFFDEIDNGNCQMMVAYEIAFLSQKLQKYIYDKKYFLKLDRKTAKAIRIQAKTQKDIDRIIADKNESEKIFKYSIRTENKMPVGSEVLFTFANAQYKTDILKIFSEAINSSELPQEVKNEVLKNLS